MTSTSHHAAPDLDRLREFAALDGPVDDAARDAARALLLQRIGDTQRSAKRSGVRRGGPAWPGGRLGRRPAVLAIGALMITTLAVGVGFGGGRAEIGPADGAPIVSSLAHVPEAAASESLRAAAAAAVGQPTVPFRSGSSWVVRSRTAELLVGGKGGLIAKGSLADRFAAVLSTSSTSTTSFDGRVHATTKQLGPLRFTSPASARAYEHAGRPSLFNGGSYPVIYGNEGERAPFQFGRELLTYDELLALPTDAAQLAERVARAAAGTGASATPPQTRTEFAQVRVIADLMTRAPLAPALRGALWRVVATFGEVRLVGAMKDPAGRRGTGVTIAEGDSRAEIVFSPSTGMLLSDWIYKRSPVTSCDRDLAPCGRLVVASDRVLAQAGSVVMGRTILSASVVPTP